MYKLVIADDEGKTTVVPLVRDEISIGRKEGNTVRLTERNVSRRHARLYKANGSYRLEDLHSYNGIRVNGQRISKETALKAGDQIRIGDYQLALQMDAAVATHPPPGVPGTNASALASPEPPARLVMITPPAPGAEFALTQKRVRVGRAEDLDIWVNHRSISREHAEIRRQRNGGLRLVDLGSANGVRVNGREVQTSVIESGDIVELGQVRFRFVPAGEAYQFDAEQTIEVDALENERASGSRVPVLAAVVIVLLAVVGASVVALSGGGEPIEGLEYPSAAQVRRHIDPEPVPTPAQDFDRALEECQAALAGGRIDDALERAELALRYRPEDSAAERCRDRANELAVEEDDFQRGMEAKERGHLEAACSAFEELPQSSQYRQRPPVQTAFEQCARNRLEAARTAYDEGVPEEALRHVSILLQMSALTSAQRGEALDILRRAGADESVVQQAAPARRRVRRRAVREAPRRRRVAARASSEPPPPSEPAAGGVDRLQRARDCTIRGDHRCVIRALEGHARGREELRYLIEAYRANGQMPQALRHMTTFVQRFPDIPLTRQYQQILSRHR